PAVGPLGIRQLEPRLLEHRAVVAEGERPDVLGQAVDGAALALDLAVEAVEVHRQRPELVDGRAGALEVRGHVLEHVVDGVGLELARVEVEDVRCLLPQDRGLELRVVLVAVGDTTLTVTSFWRSNSAMASVYAARSS